MFDSQETLRHLQLGALDNYGSLFLSGQKNHGVPGCQVDIFIWVWINTYGNIIASRSHPQNSQAKDPMFTYHTSLPCPPLTIIWLWINTYENTIFRGLFTSILTQLF